MWIISVMSINAAIIHDSQKFLYHHSYVQFTSQNNLGYCQCYKQQKIHIPLNYYIHEPRYTSVSYRKKKITEKNWVSHTNSFTHSYLEITWIPIFIWRRIFWCNLHSSLTVPLNLSETTYTIIIRIHDKNWH